MNGVADKGEAKVSKSKKKRHQDARKLANRVKALLDEGRVEEDVKGVQIVKVTKASTKQAMVARVNHPWSCQSFHDLTRYSNSLLLFLPCT